MRCCLIALVLLAACGKNEQPPPQVNLPVGQESGPAAKQASQDARKFFDQTCAMCHGLDGTGNGPMAAQLNPKPRNYTDANWQASVTDDDIRQIIVQGGAKVGKSAQMPENPGLKDKPALVDGLVKVIRAFAKK